MRESHILAQLATVNQKAEFGERPHLCAGGQ